MSYSCLHDSPIHAGRKPSHLPLLLPLTELNPVLALDYYQQATDRSAGNKLGLLGEALRHGSVEAGWTLVNYHRLVDHTSYLKSLLATSLLGHQQAQQELTDLLSQEMNRRNQQLIQSLLKPYLNLGYASTIPPTLQRSVGQAYTDPCRQSPDHSIQQDIIQARYI